jgi:hypothetical protein
MCFKQLNPTSVYSDHCVLQNTKTHLWTFQVRKRKWLCLPEANTKLKMPTCFSVLQSVSSACVAQRVVVPEGKSCRSRREKEHQEKKEWQKRLTGYGRCTSFDPFYPKLFKLLGVEISKWGEKTNRESKQKWEWDSNRKQKHLWGLSKKKRKKVFRKRWEKMREQSFQNVWRQRLKSINAVVNDRINLDYPKLAQIKLALAWRRYAHARLGSKWWAVILQWRSNS